MDDGAQETPRPIINTLNAKLKEVLKSPEVGKRMRVEEFDNIGSTPEELGTLLAAEVKKYARLTKERNMRLD